MKPTLRLGCLVLAMSVIGTTRAEANIWDWLEELNGPGPSRSRGNFMMNLKCRAPNEKDERGQPLRLTKFTIPKNPEADATCLFFDFRALHAEENALFYPVTLTISEIGTSVWLHRTVELGAGVGAMTFTSRDGVTGETFTGARMTISFPRLVFRPLLAHPDAKSSRWGFLQIYFKESVIVGDLDQGDFASKPGNVFSRRHQRVESMGFIVDVIALVGRTR